MTLLFANSHAVVEATTLVVAGRFLLILVAARLLGELMVRLQLPTILGELVAGVLIGVSGLHLIVPPEGTRSKTRYWKTGFYHIAVGARVPIVMAYMDYHDKRSGLGPVFEPTGDLAGKPRTASATWSASAAIARCQRRRRGQRSPPVRRGLVDGPCEAWRTPFATGPTKVVRSRNEARRAMQLDGESWLPV